MSPTSGVYIAGIGYSHQSRGTNTTYAVETLVSAATKALLDAGITYSDVKRGVIGKISHDASNAFRSFGGAAIEVDEVDSKTVLDHTFQLIKKDSTQCILLLNADESGSVAVVMVSEDMLWSHPYLKDSAVEMCESTSAEYSSGDPESQTLSDLCHLVWRLRGWSEPSAVKTANGSQFARAKPDHRFRLSRADAKDVPEWKDVEHRQDGKHRLGYNPAMKTKEISQEDFEAVKAIRNSGYEIHFDRKGGDRAALAKL